MHRIEVVFRFRDQPQLDGLVEQMRRLGALVWVNSVSASPTGSLEAKMSLQAENSLILTHAVSTIEAAPGAAVRGIDHPRE